MNTEIHDHTDLQPGEVCQSVNCGYREPVFAQDDRSGDAWNALAANRPVYGGTPLGEPLTERDLGRWETQVTRVTTVNSRKYEYRFVYFGQPINYNHSDSEPDPIDSFQWSAWLPYTGTHTRTEGVQIGVERQAAEAAGQAKASYAATTAMLYRNSGQV